MKNLHIDIETYSSIDIKTSGSYKYMQSVDFEILMVAYAFDNDPIQIIDLAQGEHLPKTFISAILDKSVVKHAHNANFERTAFNNYGLKTDIEDWNCTAVKAAYCGLPLSLGQVSKALKLEDKSKLTSGKELIRFFSCPIRPTKSNDMRVRNFPKHDLEKWDLFKEYCVGDVEAEREIHRKLKKYDFPNFERINYILDQKINDLGIKVDVKMAKNAFEIDNKFSDEIKAKVKKITGLDNPNSPAQLKSWIGDKMQKEIKSLAKDLISDLITEAGAGPVSDVLKMRKKLAKSSTKKYEAMINCVCDDERVHGLFQFYGANRTGRWAGRLVQLQNLPRNYIKDLDNAREVIASGDYDLASMLYDDISKILSQLIRTTFIAKEGYTFAVADFSAIEARVLSWLAGEEWREEVFRTHGKIYEASASRMFNVPLEEVTKDSEYRARGKNAELALGYQGAIGAMKRMGGEEMGMSDNDMKSTVTKWRKANPKIVALWDNFDRCMKKALSSQSVVVSKFKNVEFAYEDEALTIKLPSGRKLFYWDPKFVMNKFQTRSVAYKGVDQKTKQWIHIDTYGGKIVENVVQAISRDLLAQSMLKLDAYGYPIAMHVHDEVVCEVKLEIADQELKDIEEIMGLDIDWAEGLPLNADGYITRYYKKD